ncbi:MAG: RNA pseudouridine synthase, partial [Clostridia bacterium]|nr:RNA pseudouridine synthase [Clostridia bacterium]
MKVIYDDNQIVVVIKPQNIPTQADESGDKDILTMVKDFVKEKYNKPGEAFIGLVHRLDRPTGGVLVFARNSKSAGRLSKQIQDVDIEKIYYAVVKGHLKKPKARLEHYLVKDHAQNKVSLATMGQKDARLAVLDYEVLAEKDALSLVKVRLET